MDLSKGARAVEADYITKGGSLLVEQVAGGRTNIMNRPLITVVFKDPGEVQVVALMDRETAEALVRCVQSALSKPELSLEEVGQVAEGLGIEKERRMNGHGGTTLQ